MAYRQLGAAHALEKLGLCGPKIVKTAFTPEQVRHLTMRSARGASELDWQLLQHIENALRNPKTHGDAFKGLRSYSGLLPKRWQAPLFTDGTHGMFELASQTGQPRLVATSFFSQHDPGLAARIAQDAPLKPGRILRDLEDKNINEWYQKANDEVYRGATPTSITRNPLVPMRKRLGLNLDQMEAFPAMPKSDFDKHPSLAKLKNIKTLKEDGLEQLLQSQNIANNVLTSGKYKIAASRRNV